MRLRHRGSRSPQSRPVVVGLALLALLGVFSLVNHSLQGVHLFSQQPADLTAGLDLHDPQKLKQLYQLAMQAEDEASFQKMLRQQGLVGAGKGAASSKGSAAADRAAAGAVGQGTAAAAAARTDSRPKKGGKVPRLSKQLAQSYAKDNIIIVTWANFHFADFVVNWVRHVRGHGISNYLVGAMDVETAELLSAEGVQVFAMYDEGETSTGLGQGDMGWGSPTFHKMGRQKVDLARTFSEYGLDLCLCDTDTVWINDPTKYFERYPAAHILAHSDQLAPTIGPGDDGLEEPHAIHSAMNIGLLFFRHHENTTRFVQKWAEALEADEKAWDQNVFNNVARQGLMPFQHHESNNRLVWAANTSVVVGILPVASFASGHTYFVQRLFEYQKVEPYVVHTTFQYGGTKGKRHRLREAMLWIDPPEYYSEGRFLSLDLQVPKVPANYQMHTQLMMGNTRFATNWTDPQMQRQHLQTMKAQLLQLKQAFALAVALNRTIIMPRLLCLCDRYWGPVEFCQIPGAFKTRLPFTCPMDHILEPFNFDDPGQGPPIRFREYSFLSNPRTPKEVKEGQLVVTPSAGVTAPQERPGSSSGGGGGRKLLIPIEQNEVQLRQIFAPYQSTRVLHFSTVAAAFGRWEDEGLRREFDRRVNHMLGFWCCKRKERKDEDAGVPYVTLLQQT